MDHIQHVLLPCQQLHFAKSSPNQEKKLQSRVILPTMLQYCPRGFIGEGVFGRCRKAFFQGTVVCVKELEVHAQSSKTLLQEAEMLSRMCHPSLCCLLAGPAQEVPFQLVLPCYSVKGFSISYYDILFNRDKLPASVAQRHHFSCQLWLQLLGDISDGIKLINSLGLVYRDLKSDNAVLYQVEGLCIQAVIIDFGNCLHTSSCTAYSLSPSERQKYHHSHRHISPDLLDGTTQPSTGSDIYSLGRLAKQTIHYGTVNLLVGPKPVLDVCKKCLAQPPSARPTISEVLHVLSSSLKEL